MFIFKVVCVYNWFKLLVCDCNVRFVFVVCCFVFWMWFVSCEIDDIVLFVVVFICDICVESVDCFDLRFVVCWFNVLIELVLLFVLVLIELMCCVWVENVLLIFILYEFMVCDMVWFVFVVV